MPSTADTPRTIAVLGNPNVGKTTLFNHLCGVMTMLAGAIRYGVGATGQ